MKKVVNLVWKVVISTSLIVILFNVKNQIVFILSGQISLEYNIFIIHNILDSYI